MNIEKIFILVFFIYVNYVNGQITIEKNKKIDNSDLENLFAFSGIEYGKFQLDNIEGSLSIKLYEVYKNSTENSELIIENHKISDSAELNIFLIAQIKDKEDIINISFTLDNHQIRNSYSVGQSDSSEFNLEEFTSKNRNYLVLTYQPDLKNTMAPFGMFFKKPKEQSSLKKLIKESNMRFYIYEIIVNK